MLDYRIMIGSRNRLDDASLSGGSWTTGLPLANLKTRQLAQVARSTDASEPSTTFTLDFGRPRTLRILALVAHTCSLSAMVRYEIGDDPSFASTYYDETVEVWTGLLTAPWSVNDYEWEDDNFWLGGPTTEDIEGLTAVSTHVMPDPRTGRYLRVTIMDEGNVDGFVQLGRLFAGPAVQPRINYAWGGTFGYEFATAVEASLSGAEFFDAREGTRVFRFSLQHLQSDQAYNTFMQLIRERGIDGEVFIVPNPIGGFESIQRNFLGRIRQPGLLEQVQWENNGPGHALAFEIKELR